MKTWWTISVIVGALVLAASVYMLTPDDHGWIPHVLFSGVCCTDGTRVADMDGDGRPDIVTSIEESGEAVILFSQKDGGSSSATIGAGMIKRPEDTLPVDIEGDGDLDLFVSQENRSQKHTICFNPGNGDLARHPERWVCEIIPATKDKKSWMWAEPIKLADGQQAFVIGGKDDTDETGSGSIALLLPDSTKRKLNAWTYRVLDEDARFVMNIFVKDFSGDGLEDIAFVDKRGNAAGLNVIIQPNSPAAQWTTLRLSQGVTDAAFAVLHGDLIYVVEKAEHFNIVGYDPGLGVARTRRLLPSNLCEPKSFAIGDFNGDRTEEFAVFCGSVRFANIRAYLISSAPEGGADIKVVAASPGNWFSETKYDTVHAIDMDMDGDLDLLTDEETYGGVGQGVLWYENPSSK